MFNQAKYIHVVVIHCIRLFGTLAILPQNVSNVEQWCGMMSEFKNPTIPKKPRFSLCCMDGNIKNGKINTSMMFSFTSLGGKINTSMNDGNAPPMFIMNGENYHQMGSLLPQDGSQPKFAQLYIYDTNNEVANRMSVVGYNH